MVQNNKILLVQQYLAKADNLFPVFPLGLAYIASAVEKAGWKVDVLDLNICDSPYQTLANALANFKPDVVGISLRNIDNVDYNNFIYYYEELPETLRLIKSSDNNVPIIIGGSGFSIFPKQIMDFHSEIDYGVFLEGEETIVDLLNHLDCPQKVKGVYYRVKNKVQFTEKRDVLSFYNSPAPNRNFFQMDKYNYPLCVGVQSKRGCVLNCSYCTYIYLNGSEIRCRSAVSVVNEIETLKTKYNVSEIIFTDNVFNIPDSHARKIMNELLKRKLKIRWSAWFDAKYISQTFIDVAKESGCYRMCFSTDGIVNETLESLTKNINEDDIRNLLMLCQNNPDIDFRFSLFALPPQQTMKGILKTISFVFKTHLLMKNSKCLVSWIRLYPNTELYKELNYSDNLLPKSMKKQSKHSLFLTNSNLPKSTIIIYRLILTFINQLRSFKKLWTKIST